MEEMSRMISDRTSSRRWEIQIKKLEEENNQLKMHLSTTKSQMMNSIQRESPEKTPKELPKDELMKLEYSQSVITEKADISPTKRNNNGRGNEELTSLELLTVKNTDEYMTPMKEVEVKKVLEPLSEPVLLDKPRNEEKSAEYVTESKEQQQNPEPSMESSSKKEHKLPLESKIEE